MTRSSEHRIENFLWSIMGPADIGEDRAPDGYVVDAAAELCHKCAAPWDAHQRRHKENNTYLECPAPA